MSGEFDAAYGGTAVLETGDGRRYPLRGDRWHAAPDEADRCLLATCRGPALDIGCGPGRLAAELTARGVLALGIDASPVAVRLATERRAPALHRDVFEPLPGEGRWGEALLIDGNIGIGGDPGRLLRRIGGLLRPGGVAWVEVEPPGSGVWCGTGRVVRAGCSGAPFGWATVGAEAIDGLAAAAGFTGTRVVEHGGRWFAVLVSAVTGPFARHTSISLTCRERSSKIR